MRVGDITIDPVSDGYFMGPAPALYSRTEEEWLPHKQFLDPSGSLRLDMGGFLVRFDEQVVLVDAGIGPHGDPATTGTFMQSLAALDVAPRNVTDVLLTHLHFDHLGWASDGIQRLFPNATYHCHEADWEFFMGAEPYDDSLGIRFFGGRAARELLPPIVERLETWSGDETVLPGIDARTAPGHTPGSTVLTISSGTERAMLLGDVIHCPVELLNDDWAMIGDVDKALAARTREALAKELEGAEIPVAAGHFPGLQFGRVLSAQGVRRWVFD